MRAFAISDIHGCLKTFRTLLFDRLQITKTDELYLLGDYIDRGPASKGVLDLVRQLDDDGYRITALRGNHDQTFYKLWLNYDQSARENWECWGGTETLVSFGAYDKSFDFIPDHYFEHIEKMQYYVQLDKYLLVHAGFNFSAEDVFRDKVSMMWLRNYYPYINHDFLNGRIIVHGHTPQTKEQIIRKMEEMKHPVICIDAGCCYLNREGMGHLCALELNSRELIFQKNVDDLLGEYD